MPGQAGYFAIYVRGEAYGINNFEDMGDGTIMDHATDLQWQKTDSGQGMIWQHALAHCEGMALAGHQDWRLPGAKELQSLVDYSRSPGSTNSAAIDPIFSTSAITNEAGQTDYPCFWSSTTHASTRSGFDGAAAAYVAFGRAMGYMGGWTDVHGAGAQRSDPKTGNPDDYPTGHGPQGDAIRIYNHVRCVRAGGVRVDYDPPVDGDIPSDGDDPPVDGDEPPPDGDEPVGPVSCSEDADCLEPGNCPLDAALGCVCRPRPDGGDFCVPSCNTNDDCPAPPDMTLTCDQQMGICVPEGGPPN